MVEARCLGETRKRERKAEMSMDGSSWIAVGFDFEFDTILDEVKRVTPAVTHLEVRFDPATGKKLRPVEVEDKPELVEYEFNGKVYSKDNAYDLLSDIAEEIGCVSNQYATYESGRVVFSLKLEETRGCEDLGSSKVGPSYSLKSLLSNVSKLDDIAKALQDMGYETPEPQIVQCWEIS